MSSDDETGVREELPETFDRAADLYQRARPEYPTELFDHLIRHHWHSPGDHLLDVRCASGKATLPLAERGFRITCVELGADLAVAARRNLSASPDVRVLETFSDHIAMQQWQGDRLYDEIRRRLGQRSGGTVRRHWGGVLHVPADGPEIRRRAMPFAAFYVAHGRPPIA